MGTLVFQATLGGQVNLSGPNTASTFTISVPAVTGNMITSGDSGTVTNTMLASNVYTAPGTIGSGTPNTGAFTTLSASSTVSGTGFSTYLASPPAIGGTAPSTGKFTTLTTTSAIATTSGGTGLTSFTANGVVYASSTSALATGSALTFDGTNLSNSGYYIGTAAVGRLTKSNTTGRNILTGGVTGGTTDGAYIITEGYDYGGTAAGGAINLVTAGASSPITFLINGSEQMRLTSTGLGIGTSSPAVKLDVVGASGSGYFKFKGGATGSGFGSFVNAAGTTIGYLGNGGSGSSNAGTAADFAIRYEANLLFAYGGSGTAAATLDSAGNLGLGVTPSAWSTNYRALDVGGVAAVTSYLYTDLWYNSYVNSGGTIVYKNGGYSASRFSQDNGAFKWFSTGSTTGSAGGTATFTQAMTLDASGNLLVGTTSQFSNAKLTVSTTASDGIASTQGTAGGYCFVANALSNGGTYYLQAFSANGTGVGSITSNGTTTSYNITSDYRLKDVIGTVSGSGERIDALEPIDYSMKADGSKHRGFLAHKFQEVYPNSVTGTKDEVDAEGKPVIQQMQASTAEVIADFAAEIQSLRKRLAAAGI